VTVRLRSTVADGEAGGSRVVRSTHPTSLGDVGPCIDIRFPEDALLEIGCSLWVAPLGSSLTAEGYSHLRPRPIIVCEREQSTSIRGNLIDQADCASEAYIDCIG
jgi:hypothetical protein